MAHRMEISASLGQELKKDREREISAGKDCQANTETHKQGGPDAGIEEKALKNIERKHSSRKLKSESKLERAPAQVCAAV